MAGYPDNTTYHMCTDEIIDICKRNGTSFEASREVTLSAGATAYSIFKTASKPVIFYARGFGFDGVGINAFIYANPTYSDIGTESNRIRNPNGINGTLPTVRLFAEPTITDFGTETRAASYLFGGTSNQSSGETIQTIVSPQYILPNKEILLFFTNRSTNSSQKVTAMIEWCEPERIQGLVINSDGTFNRYNGFPL